MRFIKIIGIFIIAVAIGVAIFWQFWGPGELAEDFDLRGEQTGKARQQDSLFTTDTMQHDTNESGVTVPQPSRTNQEYVEVGDEVMVTDGIKHLVPLNKIQSGGPPKDGIPPIDNPTYISVSEADEFLDDDKLGIAIEKNGKWRFYSFQILVWHEIVNDTFDGERILVTYCPLCGTGIVFTPEVDGELVEFGTSGRLFNSNLVMYDRKTDSLWSQQGGRAIVGVAVGQTLAVRSADNVFWGEFKKAHPDAEVLSRDTGHFRDYTRDPYGGYYTSTEVLFPVENEDSRLHEKAIVYGFDINGYTKAYSDEALRIHTIVNDYIGPEDNETSQSVLGIVIPDSGAVRFFSRELNGTVYGFEFGGNGVIDTQTGTTWDFNGNAISGTLEGNALKRLNPEFGFWFSWVAFNPETELFQ